MLLLRVYLRRVDPDFGRGPRRRRSALDEAFGMALKSLVENVLTLLLKLLGLTTMNGGRGQ